MIAWGLGGDRGGTWRRSRRTWRGSRATLAGGSRGEAGFNFALRQEIEGELLDVPDAKALAHAEARKVRTTIDKTAAKRLAKLFGVDPADVSRALGRLGP